LKETEESPQIDEDEEEDDMYAQRSPRRKDSITNAWGLFRKKDPSAPTKNALRGIRIFDEISRLSPLAMNVHLNPPNIQQRRVVFSEEAT